MSQKRVYKTYIKEFKKEAVALITEQGYSVAEAAQALGVDSIDHCNTHGNIMGNGGALNEAYVYNHGKRICF